VFYLFIAASAAAVVLSIVWLRERRWRRHERAIRDLLDGADALEAQLQECRRRMQRLREMLAILPEEMSADANSALSADTKVQAALKDLLGHRLWIKQHALQATPRQLDAARAALAKSAATLGAQLDRLAGIAADLERAQSSAQSAGRRG
jgi:chromosome segregation ATPase